MLRKVLFLTLIIGTFIYCSSDPQADYTELDLLSYGFPVKVMAPDSPTIKTFDLVVKKDLTIQKGDDYYVQIFMGNASNYDPEKVKANLITELEENNRYFTGVVLEEPHGFIYETSVDSTNTSYGFKYVKIRGDKEFVFQTGLLGSFTREQVENMYKAVKME